MRSVKPNGGFTLIESLIYILLFAIIISGGFVVTYQIIYGNDQVVAETLTTGEAHFLLRKIDWALSGVDTITTPSEGDSGAVLEVLKDGDSYEFALDGSNQLTLEINSGGAIPLSSGNVKVQNVYFEHVPDDSVSGRPRAVEVVFWINDQQFGTTTKYVR